MEKKEHLKDQLTKAIQLSKNYSKYDVGQAVSKVILERSEV